MSIDFPYPKCPWMQEQFKLLTIFFMPANPQISKHRIPLTDFDFKDKVSLIFIWDPGYPAPVIGFAGLQHLYSSLFLSVPD